MITPWKSLIKAQILSWKTIEVNGLGFGFALSLSYFIVNSPPLNRDVTCCRVYLNGKKYKGEISDEQPPIA